MIGTFINAICIIAGGIAGGNPRWQLPPARQLLIKVSLGVFTVYAGLKLVWTGLNSPFLHGLAQLGIVLLAMSLGKLVGKLLHLQYFSNQLGEFAKNRIARVTPDSLNRFDDGLTVSAVLFCAAPLAILGALQDGLQNNWHLLGIKGVMDGLAVMAFVPIFGRGAMLSFLPVVAWQGLLTLGARVLVQSGVLPSPSPLVDSLHITCGLLAFSVSLIVLELKRIELTDYLPSLLIAPLLTKWWL